MKKIISLILCVLMIVPLFAFSATAANDGKSEEAYNFAPKGSAYATSQWNNDSDPRYINNGDTSDSYRYWRPNGHGRDPNMDDTEQHCGIRFQGGQYYEIQEVVIYNYMEGKSNDIKYVVEALVLGEWIVIGESRNYVPENEFTGEEIKGAKVGKLTIDVEDTVTRHIRLKVSEYGRWATSQIAGYDSEGNPIYHNAYDNPETEAFDPESSWHNWHLVPIIHELETWGVEAPAPAWDVPEGAILSTNACLSGYAHATSTNAIGNIYPALVNDDEKEQTLTVIKPYWQANIRQTGGGQEVWCEFDQAYDIVNTSVNFGGSVDGVTINYDVQIQLTDGTWQDVATNKTVETTVAGQADIVFPLERVTRAKAVKVIINSATNTSNGRNAQAVLTEMGAEIYEGNKDANGNPYPKCIFLKDFITADKKQSASVGNLAMFGTAYASSLMSYANMSSIEFINDGGTHDTLHKAWFAQTFERGTYCGVTLEKNFAVDKVVLYFNDPVTGSVKGDCVMEFDIQAKQNGTFKTIKSGITSYDAKKKEYVVSIEFDETITTNDIRIVYQSNGLVFPYIKELEIYSNTQTYDSYTGHPTGTRTLNGKAANALEDLSAKSTVLRSKYLDKISPIEYFEITSKYGIDVQSWN